MVVVTVTGRSKKRLRPLVLLWAAEKSVGSSRDGDGGNGGSVLAVAGALAAVALVAASVLRCTPL